MAKVASLNQVYTLLNECIYITVDPIWHSILKRAFVCLPCQSSQHAQQGREKH